MASRTKRKSVTPRQEVANAAESTSVAAVRPSISIKRTSPHDFKRAELRLLQILQERATTNPNEPWVWMSYLVSKLSHDYAKTCTIEQITGHLKRLIAEEYVHKDTIPSVKADCWSIKELGCIVLAVAATDAPHLLKKESRSPDKPATPC